MHGDSCGKMLSWMLEDEVAAPTAMDNKTLMFEKSQHLLPGDDRQLRQGQGGQYSGPRSGEVLYQELFVLRGRGGLLLSNAHRAPATILPVSDSHGGSECCRGTIHLNPAE